MDFMSFMAGLALTFFWLHTLLIAAAGLLQSRKLWSRVAELRGSLRPATVTEGDQSGALARHRVLQVGRTRGDGHLWFHDRGTASDGFGGALELDGAGTVRLEAGEPVEVWPNPAELSVRANQVDAAAFEAAAAPAKKARGYARDLDTEVREGSRVWVFGSLEDGVLRAPEGGKVLISTVEPLAWMLRRARWGVGLALLELCLAAACTLLIFWPPMWGFVSMIGAFLALAVFNLFQLWGKMLRDALRVPSEAFIRGHWRRPA